MMRVISLLIFLLITTSASAAVDDFTVTQLVGNDTTPPTTPTLVTPVPVATTQIDVSWATSTDDVSLTGYRLFRDASQIAMTSLSSYSDTGLIPSTTYTYTVEAYDWFFNISSTSAPGATTTLAVPVTVTPSTSILASTVGGQLSPRLISLQIDTQEESAQFSWDTNIYTKYILRWGRSSEYDLGSVHTEVYSRTHTTSIRGLEPDKKYMFELIGVTQLGHEFSLTQGTFTTKKEKDTTAPANVSDTRMIIENDSVYMQWANPIDADFTKVRVVRNYLFYPSDPADGFIVYEGSAQSVFDTGVLTTHPGQYYTIFAYDDAGNISSGAVVFAQRSAGGTGIINDTGLSASPTAQTDSITIAFSDVRFVQKNVAVTQQEGQVFIDSDVPLQIQIPVELLSGNLKTIVVTLTDISDLAQSYILRRTSEETVYQALLRNLPEGVYEVSFSIYDYHTQLQTTFEGQIVSQEWISSNDMQDSTDPETAYALPIAYVLATGAIVLLLIVWFLFGVRRVREDN